MSDDRDVFEQRVCDMLAKTSDVQIPLLSPERLDLLRALIPGKNGAFPCISLIWKRLFNEAKNSLSVVKVMRMTLKPVSSPLFRGDGDGEARLDDIVCRLPNGELRAQVIPAGNHRAKFVVSVTGEYGKRDDLSIELSRGSRLIEARPLEQKAEVVLDGIGFFTVSLFAGGEMVGAVNLDIAEEGDSGNG